VLLSRTAKRQNDPSDADAAVVRLQRAQDTGDVTWCRLDAAHAATTVLESGMRCVRDRLPAALNVIASEAR
jgi:predicted kinase